MSDTRTEQPASSENDPKKNRIRISFLLDVEVHKDLEFLKNKFGHGERPRELLRLAKIGLIHDAREKKILEQLRNQQAVISSSVTERPAPVLSSAAEPEGESGDTLDAPVAAQTASAQARPEMAPESTPSHQASGSVQAKPTSPATSTSSPKSSSAPASAKAMGSFLA